MIDRKRGVLLQKTVMARLRRSTFGLGMLVSPSIVPRSLDAAV